MTDDPELPPKDEITAPGTAAIVGDGLDDRAAALDILSRCDLTKIQLRPIEVLRKEFEADRNKYNATLREILVRAHFDYLRNERHVQLEETRRAMRKNLTERDYSFGSWQALYLRSEGGIKDGRFASGLGEYLRSVVHRGIKVEELQEELTPDWDPREAIRWARDYLAERGIAATKRRQNQQQQFQSTAGRDNNDQPEDGREVVAEGDGGHADGAGQDIPNQDEDDQGSVQASTSKLKSVSKRKAAQKWHGLPGDENHALALVSRDTDWQTLPVDLISPKRAMRLLKKALGVSRSAKQNQRVVLSSADRKLIFDRLNKLRVRAFGKLSS